MKEPEIVIFGSRVSPGLLRLSGMVAIIASVGVRRVRNSTWLWSVGTVTVPAAHAAARLGVAPRLIQLLCDCMAASDWKRRFSGERFRKSCVSRMGLRLT